MVPAVETAVIGAVCTIVAVLGHVPACAVRAWCARFFAAVRELGRRD